MPAMLAINNVDTLVRISILFDTKWRLNFKTIATSCSTFCFNFNSPAEIQNITIQLTMDLMNE